MADFQRAPIHVLVSTIVIEVGIDVPNASVMVIEHASASDSRRAPPAPGRVGEAGDRPSACYRQYPPSDEAEQRSAVMEKPGPDSRSAKRTVAIARREAPRNQQSGLPEFRVADFVKDFPSWPSRKEAFALIDRDPDALLPEHFLMRELLAERWQGKLELGSRGLISPRRPSPN